MSKVGTDPDLAHVRRVNREARERYEAEHGHPFPQRKRAAVKKPTYVGPAIAIKMMMPPPNSVVCLVVVRGGKVLGQLQSDPMTEGDAAAMVDLVNRGLRRGSR